MSLYIPIPGTDLTAHVNALRSYLPGLGMQDASAKIEAVMDAYPSASAARGVPYQKDTAAGEWMASKISQDTGLSFGTVKAVLNTLQSSAAAGKVSAAYYNPGKFGLAAKVTTAAKSAVKKVASGTRATADAILPESITKAGSGLASGIAGLGDVASMLPLIVVGVGAWWLYTNTPKSRRA